MEHLRVVTAQHVDLAFRAASVGDRVLAWLIDAILGVAYWLLVVQVVFPAVYAEWLRVLLMLVPLGYHFAFEALMEGQSPGKRALGLRVARVDGAAPTLGQFAMRWMLRPVDIWLTSGAAAVVAVVATANSQRLGDLLAGTTVIKRAAPLALADVLYAAPPPGYTPAFPEAERLTDADVRALRAVLLRLRREKRSAATAALARGAKAAVEARLGLAPVALPPETFLSTVVADYTAAHDRYH